MKESLSTTNFVMRSASDGTSSSAWWLASESQAARRHKVAATAAATWREAPALIVVSKRLWATVMATEALLASTGAAPGVAGVQVAVDAVSASLHDDQGSHEDHGSAGFAIAR